MVMLLNLFPFRYIIFNVQLLSNHLIVSLGKKRHVIRYIWCLPVNVSAMLTNFNIISLENASPSSAVYVQVISSHIKQ